MTTSQILLSNTADRIAASDIADSNRRITSFSISDPDGYLFAPQQDDKAGLVVDDPVASALVLHVSGVAWNFFITRSGLLYKAASVGVVAAGVPLSVPLVLFAAFGGMAYNTWSVLDAVMESWEVDADTQYRSGLLGVDIDLLGDDSDRPDPASTDQSPGWFREPRAGDLGETDIRPSESLTTEREAINDLTKDIPDGDFFEAGDASEIDADNASEPSEPSESSESSEPSESSEGRGPDNE